MPRKPASKRLTPRRYLAARVDASVGAICRRVERDFVLPRGAVALLLPNGKRARSDKRIRALLADWGW